MPTEFSPDTLRLFAQLLTTTQLANLSLDSEQFDDDLAKVITARRELRAVMAEAGIKPDEQPPAENRQQRRTAARKKSMAKR